MRSRIRLHCPGVDFMQRTTWSAVSGALSLTASPRSPETASVSPAQVDAGVPQLPANREQQPVPDRSLAIRTIRPRTGPAHNCPDKGAVKNVLRSLPAELNDMDPLCLSLGLGLSAHLLLFNQDRIDAFVRMRGLLRSARFPLSIKDLSDALEKPPVCAGEIAEQVRALARSRGVDCLASRRGPLCNAFAKLLAPLAGEVDEKKLLEAFGAGAPECPLLLELDLVVLRSFSMLGDNERWNMMEVVLHLDEAVWRARNRQQNEEAQTARTCENWLELFARSGASADALAHIARQWELEPPTGCADWADYLQALYESIATRVLREQQQDPQAPVLLQDVWPLVHGYSQRVAFSLALDDATHAGVLESGHRHLSGFFSLLRHVKQREHPGNISWSTLCRLAHHGCAQPHFAARVPQDPREPETLSRRLRPSDLLRLVEGPDAQQLAWTAAAVLGAGAPPVCSEPEQLKSARQDNALTIWRSIYNRVPWLETGHLVQVLRLLGAEAAVAKLTAHADPHRWPAASVGEQSARCAELVDLVDVFRQQPERVQAFITLKAVDQRFGYLAPAGTAPGWRLLNCLAQDPLLLTAWRSFVKPERIGPQTLAGAGEPALPVPVQAAGANLWMGGVRTSSGHAADRSGPAPDVEQNTGPGIASGVSSGALSPVRPASPSTMASVMPASAASSLPQILCSRAQQRLPDPSLAIRTMDPATAVPDRGALLALLRDMSDMEPLRLAMGLGWSAHFMLAKIGWLDPLVQVRGLLRLASFPLSLTKLSAVLESPPVRAYEIAAQIRACAAACNTDRLVDRDTPLSDACARLLAPLANRMRTGKLVQAFAVPNRHLEAMNLIFMRSKAGRWNTVESALEQAFAAGEHSGPPSAVRTCEHWLEVFARSGASADTLAAVARCWRLVPPAGCANWTDYLQALCESTATRVLRAQQQHPDASVPVEQAWLLVHGYGQRAAFAFALDEATDPGLLLPCERHLVGLLSLLRHAKQQGPQGNSISWSSLCRLAQHGCADPCFAARVALEPPAPETVSRRLRPSDVLRLVDGPDAQSVAWILAAVLGVGALPVRPESEPQVPVQDAVLAIWLRIYHRVPWLETGHLVQVLRLLDGQELVEKLTGHGDSQHWPCASVSKHSARCAELVSLAEVFQQQPERVQAFIDLKAVDQRFSYLAPTGTAVRWRLLNCLALDPSLLAAWRDFVNYGGAPALAAALNEEGLEMNAGGYPSDYVCPLSREYMEDPVAIGENGCKRYFSREYLVQSLRVAGPFNPLTRMPLSPEEVPAVDDEHLARIRAWRARHPELEEEGQPFESPSAGAPSGAP